MQSPLENQTLEFLSSTKFHNSISIPFTVNNTTKKIRVTYADLGYVQPEGEGDGKEQPVILFCGGMFSNRMMLANAHFVACKYKVRLITVDRPGMGGSERVENRDRVRLWLETIPRLFTHLKIQHVTLVSHSAGAIPLLNAAYHLPQILHPSHPRLFLLTPWVDPNCSLTTTMALTYIVPKQIISRFQNIPKFANRHFGGVLELSSGIGKRKKGDMEKEEEELEELREKFVMEYTFAENIEGVGLEALFCLKRRGEDEKDWDACEDYMDYVPKLAEKFKEVERLGKKLKVGVFHAESDIIIGSQGAKYFDSCWSKEQCGESIVYESCVTEGTNHDSMMQNRHGIFEKILEGICVDLEWEY